MHLTAAEEETYNRFFLPHGVTPKQFETVYHKATPLEVAKDECILRKDDPLDHVYLIIDGTTKANIRGRHLTAASFSPEAHETKQGGASGAWVGEVSNVYHQSAFVCLCFGANAGGLETLECRMTNLFLLCLNLQCNTNQNMAIDGIFGTILD